MNERNRYSLRNWIESTWLLLGGPAGLQESNAILDANTFFILLESLDEGGTLRSVNELNLKIETCYAAPIHSNEKTIQIMTIHNAKGLEFDTVILPHLESHTGTDEKEMLLWMEQTRSETYHTLLLALMTPHASDDNSIYSYIKRQQTIKMDYENGRLLYVAATRAKKQLHLFFSLNKTIEEFKPARYSLLEKLWPSIQSNLHDTAFPPDSLVHSSENKKQKLLRLTENWQNPLREIEPPPIRLHTQSAFQLPDYFLRHIGTVTHFVLQQIARFSTAWWKEKTMLGKKNYLDNLFKKMIHSKRPLAIDRVLEAIDKTLSDSRGCWILHPHQDAHSELPITAVIDQTIQSFIIDRTFIDEQQIRWIIDYKTTQNNADDLATFLKKEQEKYQRSLSHYAEAIFNTDQRPIRIGLYFPFISAWHEWGYF